MNRFVLDIYATTSRARKRIDSINSNIKFALIRVCNIVVLYPAVTLQHSPSRFSDTLRGAFLFPNARTLPP